MWSRFWVIVEVLSANLCKSVHDTINYSTSICPFESEKYGKEGKRLQKIEYVENEKSFLIVFCIVFKGLLLGEKIKNWEKIADTSFKELSFKQI